MTDDPHIDDERRQAVCAWLRSHGIDPAYVPMAAPIIATPLHEGAFQLDYHLAGADQYGSLMRSLDGEVRMFGWVAVVDTPPPGYAPARSLVWRGHDWIRHLEQVAAP